MQKTVLVLLSLVVAAPVVMAKGLLDWLKPSVTGRSAEKAAASTDAAKLLTLEPGETEMYPQPSSDGRFLIVVSRKGRHVWI